MHDKSPLIASKMHITKVITIAVTLKKMHIIVEYCIFKKKKLFYMAPKISNKKIAFLEQLLRINFIYLNYV